MLSTYQYQKFPFVTPPELQTKEITRRKVVIVGAGPVGLTAAIDCKLQGLDVLVLDDDDTVSVGSRGLCYAKRTLEILDRLGVAVAVRNKGVEWNVGRTFFRKEEVFNFNLLPAPDHKHPGMVNLQQYYLEEFLVQRAVELGVELRWKNRVTAIERDEEFSTLQIATPEGDYSLQADWLIACDGARSPLRQMLGLEVEGKVFMDRFLIADVVMKADFPAERWFWFDPPFHPNQSVLLHREADNVWRIDFQLGWDADPVEERKPENVIPRIKAMLGDDREFELEWVSVYTFQCRRMEKFRHGRVLFAGDAAHQVSPFGARGANSGIQDADNLVWKLKLVVDGKAPAKLLDTYSDERVFAADENLLNSTRSTDFITPKSAISKCFRNAVLSLAQEHAFARKLVNSGRLSVPSTLSTTILNTPDHASFDTALQIGAPFEDGPVSTQSGTGFLIDYLQPVFHGLYFCDAVSDIPAAHLAAIKTLEHEAIPVVTLIICKQEGALDAHLILTDTKGLLHQRYGAENGSYHLLRPDQHLTARWQKFEVNHILRAVQTACGNSSGVA
ncbi:FAD-dependent oxidoreductase [Undibacterium umbellatum]|uniref:FAD-dependent oxidoreductase n=1 Tax=Undibacterium umbellatum TaxID=2762300 RepID=A0ABR6ZCR8_9BURK|nr:FAD-dependent oxidoreductase [Undibacterium umbellatum]MBC3909419.1 FAD-dependent oxidoreductase [Undibacterium umbellatum]